MDNLVLTQRKIIKL